MRPGGAGVSRKSEYDLASKLQDATWARSQNLAITWIIRVVPHRRSNSSAGERIITILVMVEDVKRLSPELERDSLPEFEVFADAHIEVVDSWAAENVSPTVAELPIKSLAECNSGEAWIDTTCRGYALLISWIGR